MPGGSFETVAEVQELEKVGLDLVWVAEAYGFDGVSLMGYIAAKTETVRIASGMLPNRSGPRGGADCGGFASAEECRDDS